MNVLAIDQGTSATKALLAGPGGEVLGRGEVPVRTRAWARTGWRPTRRSCSGRWSGPGRRPLAAARRAGATRSRWPTRARPCWPGTGGPGAPLTPAIVWQDRRSAGVCARLAGRAAELDGDHRAAARPVLRRAQDDLAAGEPHRRRRGHHDRHLAAAPARRGYVTDAATASRTMLLDLDRAAWSETACAAFGLDPAALPAVADCAGVVGRDRRAFGGSLPVAGIAVDQQAALLAEGCLAAGDAKCTYGTGAFLLVTTGARAARSGSRAVRLGGLAAGRDGDVLPGRPGLHGGFGAALADRARAARGPARSTRPAGACRTRGGVTFVPALAGLGAPYWAPDARGPLTGLHLGTTRGAHRAGRGRGHRGVGRAAGRGRGRRPRAAARPRCGSTAG